MLTGTLSSFGGTEPSTTMGRSNWINTCRWADSVSPSGVMRITCTAPLGVLIPGVSATDTAAVKARATKADARSASDWRDMDFPFPNSARRRTPTAVPKDPLAPARQPIKGLGGGPDEPLSHGFGRDSGASHGMSLPVTTSGDRQNHHS